MRCVLSIVFIISGVGLLAGWQAGPSQPDAGTAASEYPNPQTAVLELLVGKWNLTQDHFDPTGKVSATVKGTEEITWALDYHAIRRDYTARLESSVYNAVGYLTWNDVAGRYDGVWFDNVSVAGPTVAAGTWDAQSKTMQFSVEGPGPKGGRQQYKVIQRFESESTRVATTYLLRGNEVQKTLVVRYQRMTPCPGKVRVIFDH